MDIFISSAFHDYYKRNPIKLIDVGASGGLEANWRRAQRHLQLIGFEPDARSFHDLEKGASSKKIYINKALYNGKRTVDFYLTNKEEISSVFAPNKKFLKQFPEEERFDISSISKIETADMDSQLARYNIDDPDFIKLDTNGSELFVLEGAKDALNKAFGLEIEVEFNQIYEGQPLFSDVDKFVRGFGFQLFDLKGRYWKRASGRRYGGLKGQLIFADALYLLGPEGLSSRIGSIRDRETAKSKILRAVSISILYGYIDCALSVFEEYKEYFTDEEIRSFYKEVEKEEPFYSKIPYFRGKGRLAKVFKGLYNSLRYSYNGWSIAQESLGNLD